MINADRAHLGYAVSAEYWGQGIATAALKMVVRDVFNELEFPGLVRLEALVEVENLGSQKVFPKGVGEGWVFERRLVKKIWVLQR